MVKVGVFDLDEIVYFFVKSSTCVHKEPSPLIGHYWRLKFIIFEVANAEL